MLTKGQRVIPGKAQQLGYQFKYPTSEQALRDLLKR
jgi:NAD dependent epimerase/dehydratase family enzyme